MGKSDFIMFFCAWTFAALMLGVWIGHKDNRMNAEARAIDMIVWGVQTGLLTVNTNDISK